MTVERLEPASTDPNAARAAAVAKAARRAERRIGAPWAWLVFVLGALYFILPLVGTFIHSLRTRPDIFLA